MITSKQFVFNPFQENTVVLSDETGECVIIDPGCSNTIENVELEGYITVENLKPVKLLNTHCHIDHVFGNSFVAGKWGLDLEMHREDLVTLGMAQKSAELYGVHGYIPSPEPKVFLEEGDVVRFGSSVLEVLYVPGHAPGHIAFVSHEDKLVVGGDVLFRGSIGRTDLPGGNMDTLLNSIREKFYTLADDYTVICGHGPHTTIGEEKRSNAFVRAN